MPISSKYRAPIFAALRIFAAYITGMLLVITVSIIKPSAFSSYGYHGFLVSSFCSLLLLAIYEWHFHFRENALSYRFRPILQMFFLTSLILAVILTIWLYIFLGDSAMTSSVNGVVMRDDGVKTLAGWIASLKFSVLSGVVSAVIGSFYYGLHKVTNKPNNHE